eukprot:CAMPEP_0113948584 /NCGR_PEP_ID=MMETSP1339-20121228/70966_1 /TAXON_ID=94617 /ORGANISM="Fibrocapsa japonica" /LENGTH=285 /DNA_ID=CAMNT_0000955689 /DNA_START=22 /DNA_END=879 /DNA_ORIENTATION=- /assembly_acc=CAM_ASM_000762
MNKDEESQSGDESSSDGTPEIGIETLSPFALAALNAHLSEQNEDEKPEEILREDFHLSQFWYDDETAKSLAMEILEDCPNEEQVIAIVSAPSVMKALRILAPDRPNVHLLEFDKRFSAPPDHNIGENEPGKASDGHPHSEGGPTWWWYQPFHFYDFNKPEELPAEILGNCDFVLADPPYLREDVIQSFQCSVDLLSRRPRPHPCQTGEASNGMSGGIEDGNECPAEQDQYTHHMMITHPKNTAFLENSFLYKATDLNLTFASKFATPMCCHINYRSKKLENKEIG